MKRIAILCLSFSLPMSSLLAGTPDQITAKINWEYENFPVKMKLYELNKPDEVGLWMTREVESLEFIPPSRLIKDDKVIVKKGENKKFMLVVQNTTDKPLYFFASPHVVIPPAFSLGFKFKCLCINHAYSVEPGHIWFRVVELRIHSEILGDTFTVTHNIIGISKEQMEQFKVEHMGHRM